MSTKIYTDGGGNDVIKIDGVCYKRTGNRGKLTVDSTKAQPVKNVKTECNSKS